MGCASSVNVQIEENKDNRKILSNGKEVGTIKKADNGNNNNNRIEERSEENQEEDYLEMPTIKKSSNDNTQSKTFENLLNNKPNIHNIKISDNFYNNKSTNYKYVKEDNQNLVKSNPMLNANVKFNNNKKEENNHNKFIPLRHPLDISSENKGSEFKNLKISMEKDNDNDINAMKNSIDERINNYNGNKNNNNNNEDNDEDGVNMGNYGDGDNDDMCNFGQSMDLDKIKANKSNANYNDDICVIFEIQSTGMKYNINVNKNSKLIDLIELFKKKIKLSPFEKPEFVYNSTFLIDFEKSISDYKIGDNSKINVFI